MPLSAPSLLRAHLLDTWGGRLAARCPPPPIHTARPLPGRRRSLSTRFLPAAQAASASLTCRDGTFRVGGGRERAGEDPAGQSRRRSVRDAPCDLLLGRVAPAAAANRPRPGVPVSGRATSGRARGRAPPAGGAGAADAPLVGELYLDRLAALALTQLGGVGLTRLDRFTNLQTHSAETNVSEMSKNSPPLGQRPRA